MTRRILYLDFYGHPLHGIGPRITISIDDIIVDQLEIVGEFSWSKEFDLSDNDHVLEIIMHNEDNDRFFDWGEDPRGGIRHLTLRNMRFANDGVLPIQFDLGEDDLEDGTPLFSPNPAQGTVSAGQGLEIYRNFPARILLPARKIS